VLVLTRKPGERIQIGENVTVVVLRTKGNRVRVGLQSPAKVRIRRGEVEKVPQQRQTGVL
jgi:carbon storage regulator